MRIQGLSVCANVSFAAILCCGEVLQGSSWKADPGVSESARWEAGHCVKVQVVWLSEGLHLGHERAVMALHTSSSCQGCTFCLRHFLQMLTGWVTVTEKAAHLRQTP